MEIFSYSSFDYFSYSRPSAYINGNYVVLYEQDGTRVKRTLRHGEDFKPDFPDSIDIKITNKCSRGCPFCHESSIPNGDSFDLEKTKQVLDQLPNFGIELAIGGGNVLEVLPDVIKLIRWCKDSKNFLPRLTLRYEDLIDLKNKKLLDGETFDTWGRIRQEDDFPRRSDDYYEIQNLLTSCEGLGISINKYEPNNIISQLTTPIFMRRYPAFVYHVILGIVPEDDFLKMVNDPKSYDRILILGYKQFGRAKNTKLLDDKLNSWKEAVRKVLWKLRISRDSKKIVIGFDNLAIEQLELESVLLKSEWSSVYFGEEFSSTMYIDAVKGEFAPTSRSPQEERVSWDSTNILDYFKENKNDFFINRGK